jgi:hypothetical protein
MKLARRAAGLLVFLALVGASAVAADWPPISPEDLSMTDIKEQPGAAAVILLREETDDDMNSFHSVYQRIKILTDVGRKYSNVELPYNRRAFTIAAISGRTVHSDGSIVEFSGKPFDKTVIKGSGVRYNIKSFNLPDVQVGSVIDFSYSLRYADNRVVPPEWEVESELFQRKAYFKFIPFQNRGSMEIMLDHGQLANGVAWAPFLGSGAQPEIHRIPTSSFATVHDVSVWRRLSRRAPLARSGPRMFLTISRHEHKQFAS